MPKKLPKTYQAEKVENKIYQKWEKSGKFNPDNLDLPEEAPNFTMVLPPPNITDKLHMGHASMLAIEDLMIRFHRLNGYRALWIPGTDHAAIATQNVVEKKLLKEKNLTRHDLGREKFLKEVWKFLEKTQKTILHQTRKMGASLDWSREAFTLDEKRQKAVTQMFVEMYQEGVIYQGERIVNWCPRCHSTLADDEIEYQAQKAKLYTFRYWKDFPIPISTTRPETKLGDTAVAVHPQDRRYQKYIGQTFSGKFCGIPLEISIIADRNVDKNFGTGAVGVTPAHSQTDWEMGEKNKLAIKKVINEEGKIKKGLGKFSDLPVQLAGKKIIQELKKEGLLEKVEEIDNNLSLCYRCGTAIEPLPSHQWFVAVNKKMKRLGNKSLKEKALEVAQKKEIEFIPSRFQKRYFDWMENLHDWCISRQIWFGHRLPVWYHKDNSQKIYINTEPPHDIENWEQDPDVLDTWFSSGMWTFSTLGWPQNFQNHQKTGDLKKYHPTQMLETGYEILTLWVSRMIMMSLFALQEIPFEKVYLHGMVLDEHGKKMSKSKGNGVDPLDMIKKYNTDAVRLALLIGNTPGNDMRLSEKKIAGYRNFTNKLWNIGKFILEFKATHPFSSNDKNNLEFTLADYWIIEEFKSTIEKVTHLLKKYQFSTAGEILYDFTWHNLADWYLEIAKIENNCLAKSLILENILNDLLKLWHPFIPFLTEYLWEIQEKNGLLMTEKWPPLKKYNLTYKENYFSSHKYTPPQKSKFLSQQRNNFSLLQKTISEIRRIRKENNLPARQNITLYLQITQPDLKEVFEKQVNLIQKLNTSIQEIIWVNSPPTHSLQQPISSEISFYLSLDEISNTEQEKKRLSKEIANLEKYRLSLEKKLANQNFLAKAPAPVVQQEKKKLKETLHKLETLQKYFQKIKS